VTGAKSPAEPRSGPLGDGPGLRASIDTLASPFAEASNPVGIAAYAAPPPVAVLGRIEEHHRHPSFRHVLRRPASCSARKVAKDMVGGMLVANGASRRE
jgi:hypothetical protein